MIEHPALKQIMREVAKEEGLLSLVGGYDGEVYSFPERRSNGWSDSKWRGKPYKASERRGVSKIATLRKQKGYTQKKVAEATRIHGPTFSEIERKKRVVTPEQMDRILSFYKIKARYYFDEKSGMAR